jgi:hypothetical protein
VAFFIPIFEPNIKHMAISSNDIKIRYVIDTTELSKAQQGFDKITAEEQDAIKELKKFNSELNKTSSNASDAGSKMLGAFKQAGGGIDGFLKNLGPIGPAIAGAFSIQAVIGFAQSVFKVTAEFEKLSAVLKNTLGSGAAASVALETIKDFAKTTPFSVQEITENFVKLANRGIKPTTAQLTNLGDLASALGKDMNSVVEAVLDVSNTERWNELGIKVQANGDKMVGAFKGVTVEVDRTEQGALKMIETFGQLEGVSGSMAAVSETLGGKVSNLGDAWDNFLNQIGTMLGPTLQAALELTSDFMDGINSIFKLGKSDAKKNADLEVDAYKGAKGRLNKLTDEQLAAELKKNNEKLKSLNTVATEYDKTSKSLNKWNLAVKVGTLGLLDLKAVEGVRSVTVGRDIKAAKEQKAALDGVNGAIREEIKARADLKKKAEEAEAKKKAEDAEKAKKDKDKKTKAEDPLKQVREQYQAQLKLAKMEQEQQTLILELQGAGKEAALAQEVIYQQKVAKIKENFQKRGIGISEQEVAIAKLTAEKSVQEYEKAYAKLFLKPKDAIEKFQKDITKSEEEEEKKRYDNRLSQMKQWQKAYEYGLEEEKKAREKAEADKQAKIDATFQLTGTLLSGFSSLYQTNINNEIAAMNKRYDNEVAMAAGNEQKIQEINNRRAEQEKELKQKAFKAEQAAAVARVVFETASIVAKWASNPVFLPLAALTLANQAAQIGFILAQPVPEFAEGTKGKAFEGGRAMVGERGVEKVVTASGKVYFTPPTATLVDLPKGSQVIPNHALSKQELFYASRYNGGSQSGNPMYGKLDELGSILKGLPITQLNMDEKGFEKYIRTERRTTKILNNRFRS